MTSPESGSREPLDVDGGPTAYPGQHDDCIATVPHFHDRPYRVGEWAATFDDGWLPPATPEEPT